MDIQYLLFLQEFRDSTNDFLTPFMEYISLFAVSFLILIPTFIYWCTDKKKGLYTLCSYYVTIAVNAVVKLTACIYRPWIRDARVRPAGDAITTATGYSFPSGHCSTAAPIYGGLAASAWKKHKWLSVICVIVLLITGFSRNYLGVHTPQDVFVGISLGILVLILMYKLFGYLEKHPEKENIFLLIGFVFGWAAIAYITFKSYPTDYVDGKLLVDPQKMMDDGYGDIGALIAFCAARFVEKKWIRFKEAGVNVKGVIVSAVGLVPMPFIIGFLKAFLDGLLGSHWGHFCYSVILVFYIITLYPLVIKLICNRKNEEKSAPAEAAL